MRVRCAGNVAGGLQSAFHAAIVMDVKQNGCHRISPYAAAWRNVFPKPFPYTLFLPVLVRGF
jgi:hypothetical protein